MAESNLFGKLEQLLIAQGPPNSTNDAALVLKDLGSPSISIAVLDDGKIASYVFPLLGMM